MLPPHFKSSPHNADPFNQGSQNTHPVYNSMNSIQSLAPDFSLSSAEHDSLNQQSKANGFSSGPFRTSSSFTPFPNNRQRQQGPQYRDTSGFAPPYLPQTDIFLPNSLSHMHPSQQQQPPSAFDNVHHSGRGYDLSVGGSQCAPGVMNNGGPTKQSLFGGMEPYRMSMDSGMPQSNKQQGSMVSMQPQLQQTSTQAFQGPQMNGISHTHGHHGPLQSQVPYGSNIPASGPGPVPGSGVQGSAMASASSINNVQNAQQQEEISTIFVVGFPDDMQEREFQNMFTFSSGFEAATLKIPNKELTAYGSNALPSGANSRGAGLPLHYGGPNDPYNIVTVNQGGVVVDPGRDGPTTSWPAPAPMQPGDEGHYIPSSLPMQPPRKQIIGFAKFRTRQEALEARDVLQGRRVDFEKGAVLKAEMAKKNLHTKRGPGVGPLGLGPLMGNVGGSVHPEALAGVSGLNGLAGMTSGSGPASEVYAQRDKELGTLGAMGIVGLGQRRERQAEGREEDERDRRRPDVGVVGPGTIGMPAFGPRGARERAEEDERERERKRKEKEAARLRQNSDAFEAFHSVPQQMVRQGANSLLSAENGTLGAHTQGYGLPAPSAVHGYVSQTDGTGSNGAASGPWGMLREVGVSAALRKMSMPLQIPPGLPARPTSPQQSPTREETSTPPSGPPSSSSQNGSTNPTSVSGPFSPQSNSWPLASQPSLTSHRPSSPGSEIQSQAGDTAQVKSTASATSSISGSQNGHDEDLARAVGVLAVNTNAGAVSPQLPSPASGASSGTGRNSGDQNPPINTLYVGNLPTSISPGTSPPSALEDRLRELFSKQPGYRKLCFRQKSNGPMCFVEFGDVAHASKAMSELNGNTLNGLIKGGGIRLSYSKNPLGVRTPTSGGNGPSLQQQQQNSHQALNGTPSSFGDGPKPRPMDADAARSTRRDTSGMISPTSSYHYTMSPPPPRFFSPPLSSGPSAPSISTSFSRASSQGYGLSSGPPSSFSPFGISPSHSTIPDQPSADSSNDHLAHALSMAAANLEASRAG